MSSILCWGKSFWTKLRDTGKSVEKNIGKIFWKYEVFKIEFWVDLWTKNIFES